MERLSCQCNARLAQCMRTAQHAHCVCDAGFSLLHVGILTHLHVQCGYCACILCMHNLEFGEIGNSEAA